MVTESHDDGEGELLSRIRKIAPDLPIAVALDFHANISPTMVEKATVISGYQTVSPHRHLSDRSPMRTTPACAP